MSQRLRLAATGFRQSPSATTRTAERTWFHVANVVELSPWRKGSRDIASQFLDHSSFRVKLKPSWPWRMGRGSNSQFMNLIRGTTERRRPWISASGKRLQHRCNDSSRLKQAGRWLWYRSAYRRIV
ncbi:unnamed protein product [Soboliphyme baturini]|uniref:Integron gene cassette protein n=1 Tax=Soboliphyme baturini TaxID=241478 RepID=A0A183IL01_9BILA|nr:unnamed protein product [Soboliphyme baturini]